MALTLREIRENTAAARQLMRRARAEKFALGSFSLDNQETLKAVARAAVTKKSPVIVGVSHNQIESIGIENVRDMVDNYRRELGIDMFLSLDYSPSVKDAVAGIENGFEFIHLDMNDAKDEPEIKGQTRMVVNYARLTGALVESEPHYFASGSKKADYAEIKKTFSDPAVAKDFAGSTGVDIYGASVGNLHDEYKVPKILDLELLRQIRSSVDCNISLHGGSGIPGHYFEDAIKAGVSKINVDRDIQIAFRTSLEDMLKENPDELALGKLMDEVIGAVQKVVEEKIDLFGSANKTGS